MPKISPARDVVVPYNNGRHCSALNMFMPVLLNCPTCMSVLKRGVIMHVGAPFSFFVCLFEINLRKT